MPAGGVNMYLDILIYLPVLQHEVKVFTRCTYLGVMNANLNYVY